MLHDKLKIFKNIFLKIFSNRDGLSLVEVLVAVSLSTIVMIIIYSANRTVIFSIKNLTGVVDFYQQLNMTYLKIDSDVSSILYNSTNNNLYIKSEDNPGTASGNMLSFITSKNSDFYIRKNIKNQVYECDIKEISYYLKEDPSFPDVHFLIRKESILYNQNNNELKNSYQESILLTNVIDIKFEFSIRSRWEKKWDSTQTKRFPKAIKTIIIVKDYQGNEKTYSFISNLELIK